MFQLSARLVMGVARQCAPALVAGPRTFRGWCVRRNLPDAAMAGERFSPRFDLGRSRARVCFLVPTLFYATRDVKPEQGPTAAALFNLSRIVGQTFGIGVVSALIRYREDFHSALLVENVNNANSAVAERFNGLVASFLTTNGDAALATKQAWASLSATLSNQAYVLAFADAFVIVAAVLGVSALLVLMLPQLHPSAAGAGAETAAPPALPNSAAASRSRS
jgi:MFS transporter, DHA2 family, multidrug resistance protein